MSRPGGRLVAVFCLFLTVSARAGPVPAKRIVSLAPHLTELVFDAGAGSLLVGAVEYSDYPSEARAIPRVGDAFRLDRERLAKLEPDLVLAWKGGTPDSVITQLQQTGYRVEAIEILDPAGVADALERVGQLAGTANIAGRRAASFRNGFADLQREYSGRTPVRVFFQVSERPLFTVGADQLIGKVIETCGGLNVFAELQQLAAVVSEESVVAADPQVILTPARAGDDPLARWRRFRRMAAVRDDHMFVVDGDQVARQSLRLIEGARQVCELIDRVRPPEA